MSVLSELVESRDAAQTAYDTFVEGRAEARTEMTDEQRAEGDRLANAVIEIDERIEEENGKARRAAVLAEARERIAVNTGAAVVREARTYEEGSPNSYFADICRMASPQFRGHAEAVERLNRWAQEVAVEVRNGTDEGKRAERQLRDSNRTENGSEAREVLREVRERGAANADTAVREARALSTGAASGGAFVTPIYTEPAYAPYREAGRAFADQCHALPLPDYGMSVYLPAVTAAAAVATQGGENSAIASADPTAGYIQANVNTEAGQVSVSQQLLDRSGPNFSFDVMIYDQLERDLAPKVDRLMLAIALAGAGAITYGGSTFTVAAASGQGVGGFYGKVGQAKAAIRTTAGVVSNPTHLFVQPTRWEYISAWTDANGRPVIVPDYAGPHNALGAGNVNGDTGVEGATGYRLNGLPVFQDLNIPTPTTGNDQALVTNLNEVWKWEGTPVTRALPQTQGQTLTVLLQIYEYIAGMARYPLANQAISGSGMTVPNFG